MAPADFEWRTESGAPSPARLSPVDDRLTASEAVRRTRRGEVLLYQGDFHNAKQLLAAMARRLGRAGATTFEAQRDARQLEAETLGRVVVALDAQYRLGLRRAPDVERACREVWGEPPARPTLIALKTLLGIFSAGEWRKKGLEVPGLRGKLTPHWGVWVPTRTEYLELLEHLDVRGKHVLDLGTGTGVIGLMLLQRGAARVTAIDRDERAVACAGENAERLGLASRFTAALGEGYPEGRFDLVVCNPPWLPAAPKTRIDRAVFDEGGAFLLALLDGLEAHAA
jgi:methylase of polypeptide subunit release factors